MGEVGGKQGEIGGNKQEILWKSGWILLIDVPSRFPTIISDLSQLLFNSQCPSILAIPHVPARGPQCFPIIIIELSLLLFISNGPSILNIRHGIDRCSLLIPRHYQRFGTTAVHYPISINISYSSCSCSRPLVLCQHYFRFVIIAVQQQLSINNKYSSLY